MLTKLRLAMDFAIQTLIWVGLAVQLVLYPDTAWYAVGIFALCISTWQILHALYVVRKYKDWNRLRYLTNIRQLVAYALLTLGVGVFMLITSFGFLFPFLVFVLDVLYIVCCGVATWLALQYFWVSIKSLYNYYYRPRSFWDL